MAQSGKRPTLGFGSGHDLTVRGIEPRVGLHTEYGACLEFSLSAPPLLTHTLSLSLKINK